MAYSIRIFLALCVLFSLVFKSTLAQDNLELCQNASDSGSGFTGLQPLSSKCISITEEMDLFSDICLPLLGKCHVYDYGEDFVHLSSQLTILNNALELSLADEYCRTVLRAYVCNYAFPGCNTMTGQPQGNCEEDCVQFSTGQCRGFFNDLPELVRLGGFVFDPRCDYTLSILETTYNQTFVYNPQDCISITGILDNLGIFPPNVTDPTLATTESNPTPSENNYTLVISVSAGAVLALLLVLVSVAIIASYLYVRKTKKRRRNMENLLSSLSTRSNDYRTWEDSRSHDYDEVTDFTLTPEDVENMGIELKDALIQREKLQITGDLGEGAFGHVYKGLLRVDFMVDSCDHEPGREGSTEGGEEGDEGREGEEEMVVAVKTLKNYASYSEMKSFLMESALMSTFEHPNVLGLLGVVLNVEERSPLLILPYMVNGDLKTYLKDKRDLATKPSDMSYPEGCEYNILVTMCYQIARGMEYLAAMKLVHRDLAARNCMVDAQLDVKVADFGLTRDIYTTDYYRQRQQGRVPVKWMAPESLHDKISNEKTDVWSYGVTCWEVFSLGRMPYPTIGNHEMEEYLEQGFRLKKPVLCGSQMFQLMKLCWDDDPNQRPTFTEIVLNAEDLLPRYANQTGRKSQPQTPIPRHSTHRNKPNGSVTANPHATDEDMDDSSEAPYSLPPDCGDSLLGSFIAHFQSQGLNLSDSNEAGSEYAEMRSLKHKPANYVNLSHTSPRGHMTLSEDHMTLLEDHMTSNYRNLTIPNSNAEQEKFDNSDYFPMHPSSPDID